MNRTARAELTRGLDTWAAIAEAAPRARLEVLPALTHMAEVKVAAPVLANFLTT